VDVLCECRLRGEFHSTCSSPGRVFPVFAASVRGVVTDPESSVAGRTENRGRNGREYSF
jgi:hypothetical protein